VNVPEDEDDEEELEEDDDDEEDEPLESTGTAACVGWEPLELPLELFPKRASATAACSNATSITTCEIRMSTSHSTSFAILVALLWAFDAWGGDSGPPSSQGIRYLALGDSFTIGTGSSPDLAFPSQLKRLLLKKGVDVRLENVAVNGYSTNEVIARELEALTRFKPDTVTLAIGANDIVRGDNETKYRENLKVIFKAIAKAGVKRVFVLPQPDWSQSPIAAGFGDPSELRSRIEAYNAILADEARQAGATYVDLFPQFVEQAKQGLIAPDGLHPSPKAYAFWAESLAGSFLAK
jgi:lysophospholipase L1-like esterase